MTDTRKMTEGSPVKLILSFALPMMLTNMIQQAYLMTDTMIVSRTLGVNALAALGATDWLSYMMIAAIQAIAQGFAILIAQDFGADDHDHLHHSLARSIVLSVIMTALITCISLFSITFLLNLLGTKAELMTDASAYLRVIFMGLPAIMLANFAASMLRACGNARTPLYATFATAIMNVVLDLLFVAVFHWGVQGAAFATILAQLTSGIINLTAFLRIPLIRLKKRHFKSDASLDNELLSLCWPMMLQNIVIAGGGLVVQSQVNTQSIGFIAGYTATNKLYGLLEMAAVAYGFAMVTYIGQNYGAKLYDRMRKGIRSASLVGIITGLLTGIFCIVFRHQLIGLFITGDTSSISEAFATGELFLTIMAVPLPILYILYVTRSTLQGLGDTFMPMVSGVCECITRVGVSLIGIRTIGSVSLLLAEPGAWLAAMILLCAAVWHALRKLA